MPAIDRLSLARCPPGERERKNKMGVSRQVQIFVKAGLTRMEDGRRRRRASPSAVMWVSYGTDVRKGKLKRQISIYIPTLTYSQEL